jgi:hypothetical protein
MKRWGLFLLPLLCLSSCTQKESKPISLDDLSPLKQAFVQKILTSDIEEGPFSFNYQFRTIFSSKHIVSLFGTLTVHDRLPHGWKRYEGKTLCLIDNQYKEVTLDDLFTTKAQKEFLRKTCEDHLKQDLSSYFAGHEPLKMILSQEDIRTFVIDDQQLFVIFEPYSVGDCSDGPFLVKLPFAHLQGHWNHLHPIHALLRQTIESRAFTSTWNLEQFYEDLSQNHTPL